MARADRGFQALSTSPLLSLMAGATFIGFAPILTKLALAQGLGPAAIAAYRCAVGGAVFGLWSSASAPAGEGFLSALRQRPQLLVPGVLFAADLVCWHASMQTTSAGQATLLSNLQVLFVVAYAWLVLKERIGPGLWVGAGLALVGVAGLFWDAGSGGWVGEGVMRGNGLATLTAVFYAAYLLSVRGFARVVRAVDLMTVSSGVAALCLAGFSWWTEEAWIPHQSLGFVYVIQLGLVSHVLGQGLIARTLPLLPASRAGVVLLIQPVLAAVLGAIILAEALTLQQVAAGVLVLVGLELARRSRIQVADRSRP
ncbi:MAG: DMT family transporter [Myxococcota bacterium]